METKDGGRLIFQSEVFRTTRGPRRPPTGKVVREAAREVPVHAECDVLVVGGGPAGAAAAVAAASAYLVMGAVSFGVWQEWWLAVGALAATACLALQRPGVAERP